jgi:hypothetical protein
MIRITCRDLFALLWMAEQYAVHIVQLRRLLSRFSGKLIVERTCKDLIDRWLRAGWIEYQAGFCWPTKEGLALVGLDGIYSACAPPVARLAHIFAVNQVRLWMEGRYHWKSERHYRAEQAALGGELGSVPDALIADDRGNEIAIIAVSSPDGTGLFAKVVQMVRSSDLAAFWFYVPGELKRLVEMAVGCLDAEEQERVSVWIEDDLFLRCREERVKSSERSIVNAGAS